MYNVIIIPSGGGEAAVVKNLSTDNLQQLLEDREYDINGRLLSFLNGNITAGDEVDATMSGIIRVLTNSNPARLYLKTKGRDKADIILDYDKTSLNGADNKNVNIRFKERGGTKWMIGLHDEQDGVTDPLIISTTDSFNDHVLLLDRVTKKFGLKNGKLSVGSHTIPDGVKFDLTHNDLAIWQFLENGNVKQGANSVWDLNGKSLSFESLFNSAVYFGKSSKGLNNFNVHSLEGLREYSSDGGATGATETINAGFFEKKVITAAGNNIARQTMSGPTINEQYTSSGAGVTIIRNPAQSNTVLSASTQYTTSHIMNYTLQQLKVEDSTNSLNSEVRLDTESVLIRSMDSIGSAEMSIKSANTYFKNDWAKISLGQSGGVSEFTDTTTQRRGLILRGFGESDESDSVKLADWSSLHRTSLIPKGYVDDLLTTSLVALEGSATITEASWSGNTNYAYSIAVSGAVKGDSFAVYVDDDVMAAIKTAAAEDNSYAYCNVDGTVEVVGRVTSFISISASSTIKVKCIK